MAPLKPKPKPNLRPVSYFPLPLRMLLLASVAVVGSIVALFHYYAHPRVPMVIWVVPDGGGPAYNAEAGELPAPEIEIVPATPEGKR